MEEGEEEDHEAAGEGDMGATRFRAALPLSPSRSRELLGPAGEGTAVVWSDGESRVPSSSSRLVVKG